MLYSNTLTDLMLQQGTLRVAIVVVAWPRLRGADMVASNKSH